ncbi:MAG TPA: 16S rRNA (guanine(966)-N(2))-methyltransferase RsmD [Gammaproteobacteria bacterium]|nr:16S rRNA (guanine(966)-N(2))-methyltransferase RsmD [Gammaproteobacteria bacterium]
MSKRPAARPGTVRIIGGSHRGRRIPIAADDNLRPTPDRIRETLFNWLAPVLPGARVLDLCAGTGVLGLEALSRGAAHCVAVERDPVLARAIVASAEAFGLAGRLTLVTGDAAQVLARLTDRFDVVFLDPPYPAMAWTALAERLRQHELLTPAARVYLEWPSALASAPLPAHWQAEKESHAGAVRFGLFRPMTEEAGVEACPDPHPDPSRGERGGQNRASPSPAGEGPSEGVFVDNPAARPDAGTT